MNNWKIAFRNFRKNKFYGLINISGLVVGLTACFLIVMYLQNELGYDQFLKDSDQIYQVQLSASFGGDEFDTSNTPPPVGEALKTEFPEVEDYTRHHMQGDVVMHYQDQYFNESNLWFVDSNFLEFFSFPVLEGDIHTCLGGINSIVLTESLANKYFGKERAIGEEIFLQDEPYTVTAILYDLPKQSSLQFEALAPVASSRWVGRFSWSWVWLQMDTYVRLQEPMNEVALSALEAKFPPMIRKNAAGAFARIGQDIDEFFSQGNRWELSLNPISDVHLYTSDISSRLGTKGDIQYVYIFGTIGMIILLLACINFMNLSTARSMGRAREVGVRKVLGSHRSTLVRQFMIEALLYSFVAGLIGVALVQLALPMFNQSLGLELGFLDLTKGWALAALLGLPLLAGLLAGSYPALHLSKFRPIEVLKNNLTLAKGGSGWVRNGLVIFQFTISVALVICTLVVLQQISYFMNGDIGLNKENVLVVTNAQLLGENGKSFKEKLLDFPEITAATVTTDLPARGFFGDFYIPEPDENNPNIAEDLTLFSYMVDDDFVPTLGLEILEGRNFDEARGQDSMGVIINEATAKIVGWENPIGQFMTYPGGNNHRFQVIGVMKDFHSFSFHNAIEAFALFHESSRTYQLNKSFVAARIQPGTEQKVLQKAEQLWTSFAPNTPFDYSFIDDDFAGQYQSEERLGTVLGAFTFLSIFVACLGLLGLISYVTEQRTKEIGIRKVLGATVSGITGMLAKDFLQLVVAAILIAVPIAWYFMNKWLMDFEYGIKMEWWVFAVSGMVAVAIAFLTVSFQSIKAALANPVKALRSE